jgi:hypothetical protein
MLCNSTFENNNKKGKLECKNFVHHIFNETKGHKFSGKKKKSCYACKNCSQPRMILSYILKQQEIGGTQ